MKAIILSAGCGSRLGAGVPKSLVRFGNGRCLLEYHLSALEEFMPRSDISIVVGYRKELVMDMAHGCRFVLNSRFDRTNTAKSLQLAAEKLDADILWVNGDVYADSEVFLQVAAMPGNVILVDRSKTSEEEVGYTTDDCGNIVRLAKGLVDSQGEALGINRIQQKDVAALTRLLGDVDDRDYFERAIEIGIARGEFSFMPVDVGNRFVKEMDFSSDFEAIDAYLAVGGAN